MVKRLQSNKTSSKLRISRKVRRRTSSGIKAWEHKAYSAGVRSVGWFWPKSEFGEPPESVQWERHLNQAWGKWYRKHEFTHLPWVSYPIACRQFLRGFSETANITVRRDLLLPTAKKVGCVITAMNEGHSLLSQLNGLQRLPFEEVIVVVNGSTDHSYDIVRNHPIRATIVHFEPVLGYDVGRAVGARVSCSDIILFLDGDMSIGVDRLLPFIHEAERGADIVLNPVSSLLPVFDQRDTVSNIKQFLNLILGRTDLQADSLTSVPHALSRRALEKLGAGVLSVPPLAQARAIRLGLSVVRSPLAVDVIKGNRVREHNVGKGNVVEQLIIGDHLEALHELMRQSGSRIRHPDLMRKRHIIGESREQDGQFGSDVAQQKDQYSHIGL